MRWISMLTRRYRAKSLLTMVAPKWLIKPRRILSVNGHAFHTITRLKSTCIPCRSFLSVVTGTPTSSRRSQRRAAVLTLSLPTCVAFTQPSKLHLSSGSAAIMKKTVKSTASSSFQFNDNTIYSPMDKWATRPWVFKIPETLPCQRLQALESVGLTTGTTHPK